jgi:plastocyanin
VVAENGKFNPAGLTAAANVPLTIILNNVDANIAHDIRFGRDGTNVASSDLVIGPGQASTTFTPSAGSYKISCSVHPRTMGGTLTVQ